MGSFISSLGSGIVRIFKDLWRLITNVDELFFNYTSASIPLFFVFLIGKFVPSVFGMMFKKKQPGQMGGAQPGQFQPGQFIGPQLPQQQFIPQPGMAQPTMMPQQPLMRPAPIPMARPQMRGPLMRLQKPTAQKPNYFIIVLVLMIVYYFDSSDDCRKEAKGTLDKKSFIFNGLWTFGSVGVIMFIMNMTILRMFNQIMGGGIIDSVFKGAIFYFVYNFVRNFRNITKRNECDAPEKPKEEEPTEEETKEGFAPIDYNLFDIKKLTDKMQDKLQNGKITKEDFTEVFEVMKKVDSLDPKDILKASNEIKIEVKKPIDSVTNVKKIPTVREEELKDSLPLERRLPKGPEPVGVENNAQHSLTPIEKPKSKRSKSIDDKVIRDDSGRIIGMNF